MDEKEYRRLGIDSQSSLTEFQKDRKKYYRRYILGEKVKEEDDLYMKMGSLVDCLLLDEENFENKFTIVGATEPTGNMAIFINNLLKLHGERGEFSAKLLKAYESTRYNKEGKEVAFKRSKVDSFESVVDIFNSTYKSYFDERIAILIEGKIPVSLQDLKNGEKIKDQLKTNEFTYHLFKADSENQFSYNQLPVFVIIDGLPLKGLLDRVIVNHTTKTIQPYDLKVSWSGEDFYYAYYLKHLTYIQAYVYHRGLLEKQIKEKWFSDYTVLPMKFVVADSIGYMDPLIYELEFSALQKAYDGFKEGNRFFAGVGNIIENLIWAKENDIWNISRTNFLNRGICLIN